MRQITGYVLIALIAVLATVTLSQRAPQASAAPGTAGLERRWEYAILRYNLMKERWDWNSPSENLSDDKLRLYHALGGQGRTPAGVSYVDIATQAGLQGWEVTTVLQREIGTEVWFKRPVR